MKEKMSRRKLKLRDSSEKSIYIVMFSPSHRGLKFKDKDLVDSYHIPKLRTPDSMNR